MHQFTVRMFVRAILQRSEVRYNTSQYPICATDPGEFPCSDPESRDVFGQFLFSYKLNPRTALFAGYTESRVASAGTGLEPAGETLFLKLGYAWVP